MALTYEQERAIIEANKKATKEGVYENPLNKDMVAVKDQYGGFHGATEKDANDWLSGGADRLREKALNIARENESKVLREIEAANRESERDSNSPQQTLANIQQQQAITSLEQAKNNALGASTTLGNSQKQKVKQNTYDANLQARVLKGQQSRNFAEFLAQRGLQSAGVAALGESTFSGQMQNTIGRNNIAENQAFAEIDRIEADKQLTEKQRLDDIAREQNRYNDQMAYQRQQDSQEEFRYWNDWAEKQKQNTAQQQLTALNNQKQDFLSNIGQYSGNYQAKINEVKNDGDPSNDWQIDPLQAERQNKINQANAQFQKQGIITPDLAPILNKPVGTMMPWYEAELKAQEQAAKAKAEQQAFENELKLRQTNYSTSKPYYAPKTTTSKSGSDPLRDAGLVR